MWFLTSVNGGVGLQQVSPREGFVALRTIIFLDSFVGLLMQPKAHSACKCLWTLVARFQIFHPCWTNVSVPLLADY